MLGLGRIVHEVNAGWLDENRIAVLPVWLWDYVRWLGALVSGIIIGLCIRMARHHSADRGQTARFLALGIFAFNIALLNLNYMGQRPTWRLPISLAGQVCAVYGLMVWNPVVRKQAGDGPRRRRTD